MIDIEPLSFITGFSVGLILFLGYNLAALLEELKDDDG